MPEPTVQELAEHLRKKLSRVYSNLMHNRKEQAMKHLALLIAELSSLSRQTPTEPREPEEVEERSAYASTTETAKSLLEARLNAYPTLSQEPESQNED